LEHKLEDEKQKESLLKKAAKLEKFKKKMMSRKTITIKSPKEEGRGN
jgi:hypothetical protein